MDLDKLFGVFEKFDNELREGIWLERTVKFATLKLHILIQNPFFIGIMIGIVGLMLVIIGLFTKKHTRKAFSRLHELLFAKNLMIPLGFFAIISVIAITAYVQHGPAGLFPLGLVGGLFVLTFSFV